MLNGLAIAATTMVGVFIGAVAGLTLVIGVAMNPGDGMAGLSGAAIPWS